MGFGVQYILKNINQEALKFRQEDLPSKVSSRKFAFNTISRDAVIRLAREQFPALARWTTWYYQRPSASGVQQGDPLGPLLFSAGVRPLAAGLRSGPVDFSVFYLDDGVLAGPLAAMNAALAHIQQGAAALGLAVNLTKSEAITVGMTSAAALAATLPRG